MLINNKTFKPLTECPQLSLVVFNETDPVSLQQHPSN